MSFLSDTGLRYFLPAYLQADLAGSGSNADPIFHLTYGLYDTRIERDRLTTLRDFLASGAVPFDDAEGVETSSHKMQEMLTQLIKSEKAFDWRRYRLHRFLSFNREERRAIIHYLEYRAKDEFNTEEIDQALESYWRPSA